MEIQVTLIYTYYKTIHKLILLDVGKSCLINTAINKKFKFNENYNPTLGFEYFSFNLKLDNQNTKIKIWDTCGQEVYRSLYSSFYKGANMAFLVFAFDE